MPRLWNSPRDPSGSTRNTALRLLRLGSSASRLADSGGRGGQASDVIPGRNGAAGRRLVVRRLWFQGPSHRRATGEINSTFSEYHPDCKGRCPGRIEKDVQKRRDNPNGRCGRIALSDPADRPGGHLYSAGGARTFETLDFRGIQLDSRNPPKTKDRRESSKKELKVRCHLVTIAP